MNEKDQVLALQEMEENNIPETKGITITVTTVTVFVSTLSVNC